MLLLLLSTGMLEAAMLSKMLGRVFILCWRRRPLGGLVPSRTMYWPAVSTKRHLTERLADTNKIVVLLQKQLDDKEKQLHERLEDKENLIALVKEQLHETEMKAAHTLARSTAVLCDRVVLDTGLRRKYDPKMTFSGRYHLFLEEEVLCRDKPALSETARGVLHQVPKEVKEGEVVKELQGLAHSVSKPLHFLSPSIGEGLYVGGDAVLMVAVTILVALLQRQHHIPGAVKVVDHTGKPVYSVVGGAVKDI